MPMAEKTSTVWIALRMSSLRLWLIELTDSATLVISSCSKKAVIFWEVNPSSCDLDLEGSKKKKKVHLTFWLMTVHHHAKLGLAVQEIRQNNSNTWYIDRGTNEQSDSNPPPTPPVSLAGEGGRSIDTKQQNLYLLSYCYTIIASKPSLKSNSFCRHSMGN